ncbi:Peptide methionine sulfoxide reductase msrB [Heterostelium album PN500]|uniref:Peptide-methionine (R)-S-oxide reductase n=1 Tax=Heterostelium pallidum (strain ATCC 26659 / Pp 5 / PN500) TaxID=670386 RepID=D3BSZ4_HETP5|nr:Peptide methionine sulfoxide reductase msrB [Heterostelium album PN500]EFA75609.1 Peptide methionine sulfoxide reductase msrB [Heterostelium album PN500]|eukprot:XP_020427743.1 Peptide methionine sulfoxide reductase msrB [Heterostelium album PN500]
MLRFSRIIFNSKVVNNLKMNLSEDEWKVKLSPEQFHVLRQKGTERAGTGQYNKHSEEGVYNCAGCETPLYTSKSKFNSGCGWPAFFEAIPGALTIFEDRSHGMVRTEICCKNCGGHLGHVFKGEGYSTPTDERHCVNSIKVEQPRQQKQQQQKQQQQQQQQCDVIVIVASTN